MVDQEIKYLHELETRSVACAVNMELGAVDLPTRHGLAKTLLQASKGTVVTLPDGKKMDARFVKNGKSGGKMNHRVSNNGLMGVAGGDDSNKGTMINGGFDIDELNEAIKRSKEDELEYMKWNEEMIRFQDKILMEGKLDKNDDDRKMAAVCWPNVNDEVIEVDESSVEVREENLKKLKKELVVKMFERVQRRMRKENTSLMKDLRKMKKGMISSDEDEEEKKKLKKDRIKQLNKTMMKVKEDERNDLHLDLIERLTSHGDDLMPTSSQPMSSQEVVDLIMDEMELMNEDE